MPYGWSRGAQSIRHNTQAFPTIIQFEEAFSFDRKPFSPGDCCIRSWWPRLTTKVPFPWNICLCASTKSGCPKWTSASRKITLYRSLISKNCRTTMRVASVKQDSPKHGTCGGTQKFVREGQPRWCAEKSKSRSPKLHTKKRFMGRGLILERR